MSDISHPPASETPATTGKDAESVSANGAVFPQGTIQSADSDELTDDSDLLDLEYNSVPLKPAFHVKVTYVDGGRWPPMPYPELPDE